MNSVCLTGNLVVDPELKRTNSGKDVCTARIAAARYVKNSEGVRESDFINVQCWDSSARFVTNFLRKGDKISVDGELRERSYDGQDGKRHYVLEVIARHVESIGSRREDPQQGGGTAPAQTQQGTFTELEDDELPF